jgi:GMP synthase (glutamine-hydrolysing)
MINIHAFQHVPFEGLSSIAEWIYTNGHTLSETKFFQNDPIPNVDAIDWLVVMGGPMGVHDEARYPWLVEEKRFIETAIKHEKTVIGICLGAQLIADVLGARVYPNQHKEIGWFPVEITEEGQASPLFRFLPKMFDVFHWHGDMFDIAQGSTLIARSEACPNQAFFYHDHVLGFQFHLEMNQQSIEAIIEHCADELVEGPYIQQAEEMLNHQDDVMLVNSAMNEILSRLQRR